MTDGQASLGQTNGRDAQRAGRGGLGWIVTITAAAGMTGLALQNALGHGLWGELLGQERWMDPIVRWLTGMSWTEYTGDPSRGGALEWAGVGIGVFYAVAAVLCVLGRPGGVMAGVLMLAGALVGLEAWLSYVDHGYRIFQLIEHTLQVIAPLAAVAWLLLRRADVVLRWPLRLAVAMTFAGHGAWALGLSVELGAVSFDYPTPGGWVEMVRSVLPALDEGVALGLLRAAGALDFAVALAVLLPGRIARPALVWAVIWGGATAAARIVANLDAFDGLDTTAYWVSAALRRAPHAGLPLALLLMLRTRPGASREAERAQPEPEGAETSAAPSGAVAPDTRQGNPSRVCFRAFLPSVRKAVHRGGSVRPSLSAAS